MNWLEKYKSNKLSLLDPKDCLPGRDEAVVIAPKHAVLGTSMLAPYPDLYGRAYFAMGCFWGAEKLFWNVEGVYTTAVGYGAGVTPNPTYEEVCSGRTAHTEVVMVVYDPQRISFSELLTCFWEGHNPTEGMRQGNDVGTQYRSGIYVINESDLQQAQASQLSYNDTLRKQSCSPTTTEIALNAPFYFAEGYHQQYLAKNPMGYCPNHTCDASGLPRFPS